MIEWPINLSQRLQNYFVQDNITEPQPLLDVYKTHKELLNSEIFDHFLPQQPGLLACLVLFGIATALFALVFIVFCILRFLGSCGSELYQVCKHPTKSSKFVGLSIGFAINWLVLAACTVFIVGCILQLSNGGRAMLSNSDEIPVQIQQLNKTSDRPVRISFTTITITDIEHKRVQFGEADLLNKYNNIRELGYEFRPMENDSDIHTQVVLFSALAFIYAAILATTFTSFVIGLREYLASYHPMDRTKNSNCCGRIFVISAMVLFASAPIILLISTFLLAYIQAHNGVCPFVQAQAQNQNIELYVNSNFDFFDPYNLLDFLNDLSADRQIINRYNCEVFTRPLNGIWISLLFLSVAVLPMIVIILKLSKYFLRMSASNYWNPAETYNTINEKSNTPFKSVYPSTIRY